jgi:hypothetical protein
MKKLFFLTTLLLLAGMAFGQTDKSAADEFKAEKEAIHAFMDKIDAGFDNKDPSVFNTALAEEALICGTDPSEFWSKKQFMGANAEAAPESFPGFSYINEREIKVFPGGNSAIVITQYVIEWSPNIPWRQVYHLVKTEGDWKVYFMNVAFVPKNEHIGTINKAIE